MLRYIENPRSTDIGQNAEAFLHWLGAPSVIKLSGEESSRARVVSTLLHGNEPSGVHAVFNFLKAGHQPKVDTYFIIASIEAALQAPVFSNRMLPGKRDLNRCFRPPFDGEQGALAESILSFIHSVKPECLVDIHNTSGSGPAFAVAITEDLDHMAVTSLFTNDLIVTDLRLGALMEISERDVVTVTIECGGVNDYSSQIIADEGLHRYLMTEQVLAQAGDEYLVNRYHNPIRLEIRSDAKEKGYIAYQDQADSAALLTLPRQAEKLNYGTLNREEPLGFIGQGGFDMLTAKDHHGIERFHEYFEEVNGKLYAIEPIKIFMVTTNPLIAKTDCLFYFISCSNA